MRDRNAARRYNWTWGFSVAALPVVWALAYWVFVVVHDAGSYPYMRGFFMLPVGLGIAGSIFALQLSDHLAWRLEAKQRRVLLAATCVLAALLWSPVALSQAVDMWAPVPLTLD